MKPNGYVYIWSDLALYCGPSLRLEPHRNSVSTLCLPLDCKLKYAPDFAQAPSTYNSAESLYIPANCRHHLQFDESTKIIVFLYMEPNSYVGSAFSYLANNTGGRECSPIKGLDHLKDSLAMLFVNTKGNPSSHQIRNAISGFLEPRIPTRLKLRQIDKRVLQIIDGMHADPQFAYSLEDLALRVHLSPSRLLHLFKAEIGIPFRRFRLWNRLRHVSRVFASRSSMTEAALDSGFSSAAHFSAAFKDTFGIAPSLILNRDQNFVVISDSGLVAAA